MKEVFESIVNLFDADTDLSTMFPNGLFNDIGYDQETLPVCIFAGISDTASYSTCNEISDILIQFTVFTSTDTECFDAIKYLKAEYDDATLTLANASPIIVKRESATLPRKLSNAWRGTIDYRVMTQIG